MKTLLLLTAVFTVVVTGTSASERRNIVVILADDLGCGDVACSNPVLLSCGHGTATVHCIVP